MIPQEPRTPMTVAEIEQIIDASFPQARRLGWILESAGDGRARVRLPIQAEHLRPGPAVSGPTLMTLADTAMYFALLATIGPTLLAVTTNLNINFMRGVGEGELTVDAQIQKLGRRLAVGEVCIRANDDPALIAHATITYSIPPPRTARDAG